MRLLARLLGLAVLLAFPPVAAAAEPVVRLCDFEAAVTAISAMRIVKSIDEAEAEGNDLVLIRLDTPGGFVDDMETVVKRMLASKVPIVVWVAPSGAKAASAGFFILLAADVAAMAPGTRTGAAATVFPGESKEDDLHLKKANQDLAALLRSIAERRGRNVEASEKTVFSAQAYEESRALKEGLIDLIAQDRDELLQKLDSRTIRRFDGQEMVLRTAGARFVASEFSFRHRFMEVLALPLVAYGLLMLGLMGIWVELTHPGLILPGVVGALSLLLFAISAQTLPISAIGILLILLAVVMFILEIKVVSFGMLTFGGIVCLILGSMLLVEGPIPELRVPFAAVLPLSLVLAGTCVLAVRLAVQAQRGPVNTGVEGLSGAIGTVTQALSPAGKIFVHGEIWNASSALGSIPSGTRVRVLRVDGLHLLVEPAQDELAGAG